MVGLTAVGKVLLVIVGFIALLGAWLMLSSFLPTADRKSKKAIKLYQEAGKEEKKDAVSAFDDTVRGFSKNFVKYIKMDSIKRSEKEKALRISKMPYTPEEYVAYILTFSGVFAAIGVFLLILGFIAGLGLFKVLGVGFVIIAIACYIFNDRKLTKNQKQAMLGIEGELPRFVSFLKINLAQNNESILSLLERYRAHQPQFEEELALTIADAKTSNFDGAMTRWDQRIRSDKLRMVTRGLINANNGDDVSIYFAMLERDFTSYEIALLRQSIASIPNKMRLPKMLMYVSIALTFFFPLIMQIIDAFKDVFLATR